MTFEQTCLTLRPHFQEFVEHLQRDLKEASYTVDENTYQINKVKFQYLTELSNTIENIYNTQEKDND